MLSRFDTGMFPMFFSPSTRIENEPNNPSQSQDNYKYNDGSRAHNDYSLFAWIGALWSLRVGTYSSARVVPEARRSSCILGECLFRLGGAEHGPEAVIRMPKGREESRN